MAQLTACPSNDDLRRYREWVLPDAESERIEAHLAGCGQCARVVADLDQQHGAVVDHLRGHHAARQRGEVKTGPAASTQEATVGSTGNLDRIGPYQLLEKLGEGGFGTVYLASQESPIRRRVALKVLKLGMDSAEIVARFEAERQALAMMDHPHVAKVFDAGTTPRGQPYFVMEHVPGVAITQYCDRNKLGTHERLGLFLQVCAAVQHAHQKGIIHRDIKPSNVLVAVKEDKAVPLVIDFGMAKALDHRLTEKSIYTHQGQIIGTPEYMSPEQAEMSGLDIDTRTDIYSLGVLLYELLTGALPFDPTELRRAGYAEIQRIIREEEPVIPSLRLSRLRNDSQSIAAQRRTDVHTLLRELRGDLDWVVMKSLEKDRTRRYSAASELAADIDRHLNHQVVLAMPPSSAYRLRKFIRRHRFGVAAGAAIAIVLIAGLVGTTWAVFWAIGERDRAEAARVDAERWQRQTAQVAAFQASTLKGIKPEDMGRLIRTEFRAHVSEGLSRQWVEGADGRMRKMSDAEIAQAIDQFDSAAAPGTPADIARRMMDATMLKPAVAAIDREFAGQPEVDATLRETIGSIYRSLGLYDASIAQWRRAYGIRRRTAGDEHPQTVEAMDGLAQLLYLKGDRAEAEPMMQKVLAIRHKQGGDGVAEAQCLNALGLLHRDKGDRDTAERMFRDALAIHRGRKGEPHPDIATSLNDVALIMQDKGDFAGAEALFRETLAIQRRAHGDQDPEIAVTLSNLGLTLVSKGDYPSAEPFLRESVAMYRRLVGNEHPDLATSLNNLAVLHWSKGEYAACEPLMREALTIWRKTFGPDDPRVAQGLTNLGELLRTRGDFAGAASDIREALAIFRRANGEHVLVAQSLTVLAGVLHFQGDTQAAEPLYREALAMYRKLLGNDHVDVGTCLARYSHMLHMKGDYAAAETLNREASAIYRKTLGADHPHVATCLNNLANILQAQKKFVEAESAVRESLAIMEKKFPPTHPDVAGSQGILGGILAKLGRFQEAETALETSLKTLAGNPNAPPRYTQNTYDELAKLHDAWHAAEPGKGHDAKAAEWREKLRAWQATTQPAATQATTQPTTWPAVAH